MGCNFSTVAGLQYNLDLFRLVRVILLVLIGFLKLLLAPKILICIIGIRLAYYNFC
jgi:hypothetical protein